MKTQQTWHSSQQFVNLIAADWSRQQLSEFLIQQKLMKSTKIGTPNNFSDERIRDVSNRSAIVYSGDLEIEESLLTELLPIAKNFYYEELLEQNRESIINNFKPKVRFKSQLTMKIKTKKPEWIEMTWAARQVDQDWSSNDLKNYLIEKALVPSSETFLKSDGVMNIFRRKDSNQITDYKYDLFEIADCCIDLVKRMRQEEREAHDKELNDELKLYKL